MWSQSERSGLLADLDEAIAVAREAAVLSPREHRDRAAVLSNLGSALQVRFERTGTASDLDEAIALAESPTDDPRRAAVLNNLTALSESGRLQKAVAVAEQALRSVATWRLRTPALMDTG